MKTHAGCCVAMFVDIFWCVFLDLIGWNSIGFDALRITAQATKREMEK